MRAAPSGRLALTCREGQANRSALTTPFSARLVPLHDALTAGGFELAAHVSGLAQARERPDHGAVVDALVAQIGAADDRMPAPEHIRELATDRPPRRSGRQ